MIAIQDFIAKKQKKQKISMITCYDSWSAKILDQTNIDCLLVGDSLAMVMHGHSTTLNASIEIMALHTEAVARVCKNKFIVGDLPFLSYRKDLKSNVEAAEKLMKAGAHSVKLEGADGNLELVYHLVQSGIPVMGHLGLTPQSVHQLGGFKVQGRDDKAQQKIFDQAMALEKAGAFCIVLECVPSSLAKKITEALCIPTIGIGAGADTDGQVLVFHDMLGLQNEFKPKFLRKYLDGFELIKDAVNDFHSDVTEVKFPTAKESYL